MAKKTPKITTFLGKPFDKIINHLHDHVMVINNSKLFAGCMIIILNIASKFTTIKLSKTMESYLKFTFSRQILVFAIAWMGTRDIYVALLITGVFVICSEMLFHEESAYCCLPSSFTDHHLSLLDNENQVKEVVSDEDIKKAKETLAKAEVQKNNNTSNSPLSASPTVMQSTNMYQ